jgi:hypothetical protein
LVALALGACSGKTSTTTAPDASNVSRSGAAATDANAPLYPDWARAVAPQLYQFQTTDDRATVADWYKSHVNASWASDATTRDLSTTVNGVKIGIRTNPAGAQDTVKTMIELSRG